MVVGQQWLFERRVRGERGTGIGAGRFLAEIWGVGRGVVMSSTAWTFHPALFFLVLNDGRKSCLICCREDGLEAGAGGKYLLDGERRRRGTRENLLRMSRHALKNVAGPSIDTTVTREKRCEGESPRPGWPAFCSPTRYVLLPNPEAIARTAALSSILPSPCPPPLHSRNCIQKERKKKYISLQLQRPLHQNLPYTLPDPDPMRPLRQHPLLLPDVPDTQVFPAEGERECLRFTGGEQFLLETAQGEGQIAGRDFDV